MAAAGVRRKGTTTTMASRIAHSLAKKIQAHQVTSVQAMRGLPCRRSTTLGLCEAPASAYPMRWCSTVQTSEPPMVTMTVFGSGCSTTIDPPPVWASPVPVVVTSARRARTTIR